MTTTRVAPSPDMVRRQTELFDLYDNWPGNDDPDDDPEFVAQAREIMGLPPLTAEVQASAEDIPDESEFALALAWLESVGEPVAAAAGHDITPGKDRLHHYWVFGEGAPLWNTWTELVAHLTPHVGERKAKIFAAAWFHERYGFWPGDDRNRVKHGKPPRGERIGPG